MPNWTYATGTNGLRISLMEKPAEVSCLLLHHLPQLSSVDERTDQGTNPHSAQGCGGTTLPSPSLDTSMTLITPLAPSTLTAHSFPLFPAQVSFGESGILGSAISLEPPLSWKLSPVSSGVGWVLQLS